MNEEIKKATKTILEDLHDAGKRYGEDIGYAKDDILYEMRLDALTDAWAKIDQKLKEQYLQGAKDMREATKIEELVVADFDGTNSTDISMRVGYNMAVRHIKRKAQQFIDSLS